MSPRPRPLPLLAATVAVAAVAAILAILLMSKGAGSPASPSGQFDGAALVPPGPAPGFTLQDQDGRPVSLASYRGRVVVIGFLSSRCGAPCVLIAQQIRGALDQLAQPAPVLLVSADPAGDTAASVTAFLARMSLAGRARFLTGPPLRLRAVWRAYRVVPLSGGTAAFARAATVVLVDRAGRERVLYGPEQLTPEALAHDIGKLQGG